MNFYQEIRHRLGERIQGFDMMFDYLSNIQNPVIIETGCARLENNYEGDGQSSILFDRFVEEHGGEFHTIDISQTSVDYCRSKIISSRSHVHLADSITKLKSFNQEFQQQGKSIDLLYLDSFDASRTDPDVCYRSSLHHLYEFVSIYPSLKSGSLVAVDDNWLDSQSKMAGKGQLLFDYMEKASNNLIHNGYQLIWRI